MGLKRIAIIGGGISGLALLHYLNQRNTKQQCEIVLFEKNAVCGGTIGTQENSGCFFETGPNGFLDSNERTIQFIKEVGGESALLAADEASVQRFISLSNELFRLPSNFKEFLKFKPMNLLDKCRVFCEIFTRGDRDDSQTIYEFGLRHFGRKFTELFFDPMVGGVFGGKIEELNLKLSFPRLHNTEQIHSSLIRALMKRKKEGDKSPLGRRGQLMSFQNGMGQLIGVLQNKYSDQIVLGKQVVSLDYEGDRYKMTLEDKSEYADEVYLCTPAYAAQRIIKTMWPQLAKDLEAVFYAPIAVVNLVYWKELMDIVPAGFGYLIPSKENKKILGVLFEGNVFPRRCPDDRFMFRVMLGGARHPDILKLSKEELIKMAKTEIVSLFKVKGDPQDIFVKIWEKGIPQYDSKYYTVVKSIEEKLKAPKNFHLVANYLRGISINDCINNAYRAAQKSHVM